MFLKIEAPRKSKADMGISLFLGLQVVYGGHTEWYSVWPFCSSPEWFAHHNLPQVIETNLY